MWSKPDCRFLEFLEHLNLLTISEMQLIYEVGVPYLLHDLNVFGVPDELVLLWCAFSNLLLSLSKHGVNVKQST